MSNQISIVYMHSNINPDINPILLLYLFINFHFHGEAGGTLDSGVCSWDGHVKVWRSI